MQCVDFNLVFVLALDFHLPGGGAGGAAIKNDRKFFGFAPREQGARGRGASVIHQNPADFQFWRWG